LRGGRGGTHDERVTVAPSPTVPLPAGTALPVIGLGTGGLDDDAAASTVATAVEQGYRLVDTAESYGNERGVGLALRRSGVPREQLLVATKFSSPWHGRDLVARALDASLERLGLDYVDLLLVHWPNPRQDRYVEAWQGLLDLRAAGRIRAAGVSNFTPAHLERLRRETGQLPEVNQIQLCPTALRPDLVAFHRRHGIVTQTWSPLGRGATGLLAAPAVTAAAGRLGVTPGQVVLRWHVQQGLCAVPLSRDPQRMRDNLDVFGFALTPEEMAALDALDGTGREILDAEVVFR